MVILFFKIMAVFKKITADNIDLSMVLNHLHCIQFIIQLFESNLQKLLVLCQYKQLAVTGHGHKKDLIPCEGAFPLVIWRNIIDFINIINQL
jgi:hypothetical protein